MTLAQGLFPATFLQALLLADGFYDLLNDNSRTSRLAVVDNVVKHSVESRETGELTAYLQQQLDKGIIDQKLFDFSIDDCVSRSKNLTDSTESSKISILKGFLYIGV